MIEVLATSILVNFILLVLFIMAWHGWGKAMTGWKRAIRGWDVTLKEWQKTIEKLEKQ